MTHAFICQYLKNLTVDKSCAFSMKFNLSFVCINNIHTNYTNLWFMENNKKRDEVGQQDPEQRR